MTSQTRKWLGVALLAATVVIGVLVQRAGTKLIAVKAQALSAGQSFDINFTLHWSASILLVVGLVGIVMVLLPQRKSH
jgi:hypothetical protein